MITVHHGLYIVGDFEGGSGRNGAKTRVLGQLVGYMQIKVTAWFCVKKKDNNS